MRVIDVISWFSCSETLIYIIKFQFQPNLRWSNFWLYYCEIQTSNGFSALVFWDMKILKPVLCLFMNLEAMLEPAESSEKVTKIQPPYWFMSNLQPFQLRIAHFPRVMAFFLLSQFSRNFAKNGVKSFAFRENLKTQKYSHSIHITQIIA